MREFCVELAHPEPLETSCRIVKIKARKIAEVLNILEKGVREDEYIHQITIKLFGRVHLVWDYINGNISGRLHL